MNPVTAHSELAYHLSETRGLASEEVELLVLEVLNYFRESPEEFVRRRHRELQGAGLPNPEIFEQILAEIPDRRFPAGPVSMRQIRRMVYG